MTDRTLKMIIATDSLNLLKKASETAEHYEKEKKRCRAELMEEVRVTQEWFKKMDKELQRD